MGGSNLQELPAGKRREMMRVMHMVNAFVARLPHTECGIVSDCDRVTARWAEVTCRNCLRATAKW